VVCQVGRHATGSADTHALVFYSLHSHAPKPVGLTCRGRQVALDVAEALDYLHTDLKIMHSDVRSS
jgi:hypothetical protein